MERGETFSRDAASGSRPASRPSSPAMSTRRASVISIPASVLDRPTVQRVNDYRRQGAEAFLADPAKTSPDDLRQALQAGIQENFEYDDPRVERDLNKLTGALIAADLLKSGMSLDDARRAVSEPANATMFFNPTAMPDRDGRHWITMASVIATHRPAPPPPVYVQPRPMSAKRRIAAYTGVGAVAAGCMVGGGVGFARLFSSSNASSVVVPEPPASSTLPTAIPGTSPGGLNSAQLSFLNGLTGARPLGTAALEPAATTRAASLPSASFAPLPDRLTDLLPKSDRVQATTTTTMPAATPRNTGLSAASRQTLDGLD